jgi:hypothetical protein
MHVKAFQVAPPVAATPILALSKLTVPLDLDIVAAGLVDDDDKVT